MPLPNLIDTHAHLDFHNFDTDREDVLLRARETGVTRIINIATSLATSRLAIALADQYEAVWATVGVHPHDSNEVSEEVLAELRSLYQHPKVVAVGEIGLDYYRMYQPVDVQKKAFRRQLELALALNAPVIIHTREAEADLLEMLLEIKSNDWAGVFHCFPGDIKMANQVLEMGFHISFTGSITFKNFKGKPVIQSIPLERLLLETDCPFMTPVPHRGKRNEPAYVHFVGQKIAEFKEVPFEAVVRQTSANAEHLFKI